MILIIRPELKKEAIKYVRFTHVRKETKFITKLFKHTKLKIEFKTNNSIQKLFRYKNPFHKYLYSGAYRLTYSE
jgi:hypothetical protein